jgi:hypothetical protein
LRWSIGKGNTLFDVALETIYTGLEEFLLVLVEVCERVNSFVSSACLLDCQQVSMIAKVDETYAELNWDREELKSGLLSDSIATWHTSKVDECWFNNTLLTVQGLKDLLRETNIQSA